MEDVQFLTEQDLTIPYLLTHGDSGTRRVVLGVHGLTGCARDQIQTDLAEEMELFGAAVYRFDFPGHGENPMDSSFFTLENCRRTLLAMVGQIRRDCPGMDTLCIFASGFGAYVTLSCMEALTEMDARLRLVLQTPVLKMEETMLKMTGISQATLRIMERITFPTSRPLTVSYGLWKECRDTLVIQPWDVPILILHGEDDAFIPMAQIQSFVQMNEQTKLVVIPGTSHRFKEEGAWDMVLDLARDWFEYEQVLLSDWS